jgi:hypothetical protein
MPHITPTNLMPPSANSGALRPKLKKKKAAVMPTAKKKNPLLATPKLKSQGAPKPYDPYAPLDPSAIETNARARAQSQVQPQLDNLASTGRDAASAHAARQGELTNWYGNFQSQLDKSYGNTAQALNQLITLNSQGNTDNARALAAALQGSDTSVSDAGAMMGAVPKADQDEQILAAAQANSNAQNNFVGASAANQLSAQGSRDATLAGIGRIDAGNTEDRRYNAQQAELGNQRQDVLGRIGDLTSTARGDIQGQEAQKMQLGESRNNRLFQQYLAEQELGLKKKDQSFQQWLSTQNLGVQQGQLDLQGQQLSLDKNKFAEQTKIDWANVGINKLQAQAALNRINKDAKDAKTGTAKERAQLRAKQWTTGLELLSSYMTPQKGEGPVGVEDPKALVDTDGNPLTLYRRSYDDALRILTGKARMSRKDALEVLMSSDFASWRSRAARERSGKPSVPTATRQALSATKKAAGNRVVIQPLKKKPKKNSPLSKP